LRTIYDDFGDVRYTGDKYLAFTNWWRCKINANETRGEYLFAEPLTSNKVRLIEDSDVRNQSAFDEDNLLISIPKSLTRKQIDKGIEKILKKEITFERGRQTINPSRAKARYALTKPVKVKSLKVAFDLYEVSQKYGETIDNFKLAKLVGVKVNSAAGTTHSSTRRKISTAVSRKKKLANDAIQNVVHGWFL